MPTTIVHAARAAAGIDTVMLSVLWGDRCKLEEQGLVRHRADMAPLAQRCGLADALWSGEGMAGGCRGCVHKGAFVFVFGLTHPPRTECGLRSSLVY